MNENQSTPARESKRAFTLVELLAVVGVVALLLCLCLPAFARVRSQTLQAQCAANLKQFTLAFEIYGTEHSSRLPGQFGGYWAWDLPVASADLLGRYGAQRQQMYCPANPAQDIDALWNYAGIRVIGYALTLQGASVSVDEQNSTLSAHTQVIVDKPGGKVFNVIPSQRVLVADATLSLSGQNKTNLTASYQWFNIGGGYSVPGWPGHRTSHLSGTLPVGGNLGMLDGHVEWRVFQKMSPRTAQSFQGVAIPTFWW
jgi:prepilin-type N-terminal cleavage/methylation domain-containing protein/prepilin-type processing-associated H-X9-DG protein